MKKISILFATFAVSLFIGQCDNPTGPAPIISPASQIEFTRAGGGEKHFFVSSDGLSGRMDYSVTSYRFKDTAVVFSVVLSSSDPLFVAVSQVIKGEAVLTGDFKQPTAATGTWAYISAITAGSGKIEITNTALRTTLFGLEQQVETRMGGN
jgi:hypothetical protein